MDLSDAYANSVHIPGGDAYPARWAADAAAFRARQPPEDLPYALHARERLQLGAHSKLALSCIACVAAYGHYAGSGVDMGAVAVWWLLCQRRHLRMSVCRCTAMCTGVLRLLCARRLQLS